MHFEEITFNPSRSTHPKIQRLTPPPHTHPLQMGTLSALMSGLPVPPPRAQHGVAAPMVVPVTWCLSSLFGLFFFCFFLDWLVIILVQNPNSRKEDIMESHPSFPYLNLHLIPFLGGSPIKNFLSFLPEKSPGAGRAPVPLCSDCSRLTGCPLGAEPPAVLPTS